ncbi:MAG: hypothetical protein IJ877_06345 [Candidatus Gastranaerophilales bacterium]|nr:hypothetical protein [Candidatus Gastranaerophilales bacterium]
MADTSGISGIFGSHVRPVRTKQAGFQANGGSGGAGGIGSSERLAYRGGSEGIGTTVPSGMEGSLFDGFNVPINNGTGELIPDISDREDAIEGSGFKPYFC